MKRLLSGLLCLSVCFFATGVFFTASADNTPSIEKEKIYAALFDADLTELRKAIDEGLITSVELTEYYLDRIETYGSDYNCFVTMCDDALDIAAERDKLMAEGKAEGLLFGIPVVIKDNINLSGYHTTNGFRKNSSQIASSNAFVTQRLIDEGAVIIAKTNMSTGAQDARASYSDAIGETKNAYNNDMASGGSSGGTATAISLNFSAVGLGTDTNSSLRIPAALSGGVSMRPTFDKISLEGIKKLNGNRDTVGAITRSVQDQAIMLDLLTKGEHSYFDNLDKSAIEGLKIGVLKELSYEGTGNRKQSNIDSEVAAAFEKAICELRDCGAEVVDISMPRLMSLSNATFTANDKASQKVLYDEFEKLLVAENISAVIYPTYLSTPLKARVDPNGNMRNIDSQLFLNNCRVLSPSAGIPDISVPIGVHSLGAGIGMEIASLKDNEQLLLNIAYAYESKYNHRTVPNGAPSQYAEHYVGSITDLLKPSSPPSQKDEEVEFIPIKAEPFKIQQWHIIEWSLITVATLSTIVAVVLMGVVLTKKRKEF